MTVAAGPTPQSVTLPPGRCRSTLDAVYRFTLRAEDGSVAGSWAFQTRAPLQVVGTLPGDATTAVPIDTGIEVTFDQDGAGDLADPLLDLASGPGPVPAERSDPGVRAEWTPSGHPVTTVTIRRGLPVQGTDLTLEKDVRFRFETA